MRQCPPTSHEFAAGRCKLCGAAQCIGTIGRAYRCWTKAGDRCKLAARLGKELCGTHERMQRRRARIHQEVAGVASR